MTANQLPEPAGYADSFAGRVPWEERSPIQQAFATAIIEGVADCERAERLARRQQWRSIGWTVFDVAMFTIGWDVMRLLLT